MIHAHTYNRHSEQLENIEKDQRPMCIMSWKVIGEVISSSWQKFMGFTLLVHYFRDCPFKLSRCAAFFGLFSQAFLSNFSLEIGNTSGFGMQLCFGVRLGRYWGVCVQHSRGAWGDLRLFTQPFLKRLCKAAHLLNFFAFLLSICRTSTFNQNL